jgi:hypothetical protein
MGPLADYALIMILGGKMELRGALCGAGDALLLTRGWEGRLTPARAARPLDLLLATPPG